MGRHLDYIILEDYSTKLRLFVACFFDVHDFRFLGDDDIFFSALKIRVGLFWTIVHLAFVIILAFLISFLLRCIKSYRWFLQENKVSEESKADFKEGNGKTRKLAEIKANVLFYI